MAGDQWRSLRRDGARLDERESRASLRPHRAQRSAPHPIQWLSDNGPCYTARETCEFARALGLVVCTTPTYSPQSNGMAEAFVKTFKRDYVYVNRLPSAAEVIARLPGWFTHYNEIHPHQGLGMRSPREYRRAVL